MRPPDNNGNDGYSVEDDNSDDSFDDRVFGEVEKQFKKEMEKNSDSSGKPENLEALRNLMLNQGLLGHYEKEMGGDKAQMMNMLIAKQ